MCKKPLSDSKFPCTLKTIRIARSGKKVCLNVDGGSQGQYPRYSQIDFEFPENTHGTP
jgi:hypothetical protein